MNKPLSYILVGGASALAGAVAGYFFCKKRMQDSFEEEVCKRVNEQLDAIKKDLNKPSDTKKEIKDIEEVEPDIEDYMSIAEAMIRAEYKDEYIDEDRLKEVSYILANGMKDGKSEDQLSDDLREFLENMEEDPDVDIEAEAELSDEPQLVMEEYAQEPPHVIPLEEYSALPPYFEFMTYHYFEVDDVLIDDGDTPIDDVERFVGDALVHFDENEIDGDCVYVLNGSMGIAVEIVRLHTSYSEWGGWGSYGS